MKLYEPLPKILIFEEDDNEYPINSDYRVMVRFSSEVQKKAKPPEQIIEEILPIFYTEKIPQPMEKALKGFLTFYNCNKKENNSESKKVNFDFDYDAYLLKAAFKSEYEIDLHETKYLHWWDFIGYFNSLPEDTEIVKIIGYRSADTSKMSKEMKAFYNKLKRQYALPLNENDYIMPPSPNATAEEKQAYFNKIKSVVNNNG